MTAPFFAVVNAESLGPAGFTLWFEVLADFAYHTVHVRGAAYDDQVLLDAIGQEPTPYISAVLHLLEEADHEQLHGLIKGLGPHAILEHMLRCIVDEADEPVSRAQIILTMHAEFAAARDAAKAQWAEL